MDYAYLIKVFGAFFAIMNPFVNLPVFLAMTQDFSVAEQRKLAIKVASFSLIMALVILAVGQAMIQFFGISIDDFRVAGGLVLASIAWSMLHGENSSSHHGSDGEKEALKDLNTLAFYPMTFPMIIGPGTIATLIIFASQAGGAIQISEIVLVLTAILLMLFVVFYFASYIGQWMSQSLRVIMTRLMGMILLAIAVEMVVAGLKALFV